MKRRTLLWALVALCLASPAAHSQNLPLEAISDLSFNFGNPGARSLGMGGAFLALADDASASEANPAGLTILALPEVSLELRTFETSQTFLQTSPPDVYKTYSNDDTELAFGSFVFPRGRFVGSVYYHKPLVQNNETPLVFNPVQIENATVVPFSNSLSVEMETLGIAGAWKFDRFSIGLAARYQSLSETAVTTREGESTTTEVSQVSDDSDISITAGIKWEVVPTRFNIGAVYKQGSTFDTAGTLKSRTVIGEQVQSFKTPFNMPDVIGFGIAVRPVSSLPWWIVADVNSISYSDLMSDPVNPYTPNAPNADVSYKIDDGTELRLGTEYTVRTAVPIAFRVGYWVDPDHQIKYTGNDAVSSKLFPGGDDVSHFSLGVGFNWAKFQVQAAYDSSDDNDTAAISAVLQF